jgi:hypothetical protein
MAALIAEGRIDYVDFATLTRERLDDPARWVNEELHV